jgi:hypothetical protein
VTPDTDPWPFGAELERHRHAAGLSIRKAAKLAGISEGWWRQLETGVQKVGGQAVPIGGTKESTVSRVARAVSWNPNKARALAGFPPESADEPDVEADEDFPVELWRELKPAHRAVLRELMDVMVDPDRSGQAVPPPGEAQMLRVADADKPRVIRPDRESKQ